MSFTQDKYIYSTAQPFFCSFCFSRHSDITILGENTVRYSVIKNKRIEQDSDTFVSLKIDTWRFDSLFIKCRDPDPYQNQEPDPVKMNKWK